MARANRSTRADLARHAPALACYFCLTLAVESSATPLALVRNRALAWDAAPERANRFYAFAFAVATLKPLYASVSDGARARGRGTGDARRAGVRGGARGRTRVERGADDGADVRVRDAGERGRGARVRVVGWIRRREVRRARRDARGMRW